jgi:hypothetical protein
MIGQPLRRPIFTAAVVAFRVHLTDHARPFSVPVQHMCVEQRGAHVLMTNQFLHGAGYHRWASSIRVAKLCPSM